MGLLAIHPLARNMLSVPEVYNSTYVSFGCMGESMALFLPVSRMV